MIFGSKKSKFQLFPNIILDHPGIFGAKHSLYGAKWAVDPGPRFRVKLERFWCEALSVWGQMGGRLGTQIQSKIREVLNFANTQGLNFVDTADSYGLGKVEESIGKTLSNKDVIICTKFGNVFNN